MKMAEMARAVAAPRSVEEIFTEVTEAAVELIPGVSTAGILLIRRGGRFESHAGTTDLPHQLDELQHRHQQGPCMDSAIHDVVVRTDDFREEQRWPQYSPAVLELGVRSGISFKLYTKDRTAGALNLFGFEPTEWDAERQSVGTVLAAHAAAAIMSFQQGEELQSAVTSRDRIGQAKGIIMERFGIDDVQAFDMLRQLSQEGNAKLVDIAQRVIDTRGQG